MFSMLSDDDDEVRLTDEMSVAEYEDHDLSVIGHQQREDKQFLALAFFPCSLRIISFCVREYGSIC